MRATPRIALAAGSVALVVLVVGLALVLAPAGGRWWFRLSALVAVVAAFQAVASDPRDLAPALGFAVPPVLALLAPGSATWLIGPLAALLLVAGELGALSWECQGEAPLGPVKRRRLLDAALLGAVGLAAGLAIGWIAPGPLPVGGTVAAGIAAIGLAGVGALLFREA